MTRTLALVWMALSSTALAGDKRAAVMDLLGAIDTPAREADFKALGDGVDAELMEIAADGSVPSTRRGNAVVALQYYPSDAVRGFLEQRLASHDAHDALVRRKAVTALAVFGPSAVPQIEGALADPDVQLRIAAAHALGAIGDDAAKKALQARVGLETETAVKDAIAKSLGGR